MRVWRREEDFDLPSCVVALGTFDGVHIGHQALIRRAMAMARELDTACVVYTFRNHPLSVLCPERAPEALLQADEKLSKLSAMGVDGVMMLDFTAEYAATEPTAYLEGLVKRLHVRGVVAGFNYSFGAGGRGNAALIRGEAARLGYRAEIVDAVTDEGDVVSSTLLRRLRRDGERERYLRLLRLPR